MKKYLIPIFVFSLVAGFCAGRCAFAHKTVDFHGTIQIAGLGGKIKEEVEGEVAVSQWGHEETHGNFEEALFYFVFPSENTGCGNLLNEGTATVSVYRENKYSTKTKKFPLDVSEDGMAEVIERILNKHGEIVQNTLGLDECFSITDGTGTTESGKIISFARAYVAKCKAVVTSSSVHITFRTRPKLKTYDAGYQNMKEYTLKISGRLEIPYEHAHH